MVQPISQHHTSPLGYQLTHHGAVGQADSSRLTVTLSASPTHEHFDPEEMHVTTATTDLGIDMWAIRHRSVHRTTDVHVCAGPVRLTDRVGKTVQFFTFGGEMRIEPEATSTRCTLCSPAPIIALDVTDPTHLLLAVEAEALLAVRRAAWSHQRGSIDTRLACADPLELYGASLQAIRARLAAYPPEARGDTVRALLHLIDTSLRDLEGKFGSGSCFDPLDEVL